MQFPIYIKYPSGNTFIKIESNESLVEVTRLGETMTFRKFEASDFSDRIYIQDLISNVEKGLFNIIEEQEFETTYSLAKE